MTLHITGATIRLCGKEFKVSFSRIIYAVLFIACAVLAWILGIQLPEDKLRAINGKFQDISISL